MKGSMIARVAKDPELRYSDGGKAWASVRVGIECPMKQDGEWKREVIWATAKVFGPTAEHLCNHAAKGTRLIIVGSLQPNAYTAKDGTEVNDLQLMVDEIGLDLRFGIEAPGTQPASKPAASRPAPVPSSDDEPF